ncbi:unnamed protein product [Effrenium voratum]|uniref:Ketosynthase family 3 (KS3) domain-containing protein n=1 Tax=Effrenium voratum TaxID=2562239 RepID=A0AA36MI13_9DINO|nr:unnamed protein product [Effrenium voratum]CAJ1372331.1 unnamed protein product [Effrenium voratum]CAJ1432312.1 unnamed protein product [Effrenium voratum]
MSGDEDYDRPHPEDGGYDVAWPSGPDEHEEFSATVAETVNDKGYCVIEMPMGDEAAKEVEASMQQMEWGVFPSETEEEYLGVDVVDSKVSWLQYVGSARAGLRMFDIEEMGPSMQMDHLAPLEMCDQSLTNIAALMWPYTPEYEDDKAFAVFQRTSGLVRASMNGDEGVRSRTFGQDEQHQLDSHIAFVDGKRLCMIFLVDNEGGELELFPNPTGYDYNEVTLPLSKGKLVVFRCDALGLSYSYRPKGKNLAILSWVLDIPSTWKEKEEALRIIDGPDEPQGRRNNVMGVHTRYPGLGFQVQAFWNMLVAGSDTQVKVPLQRWDTEIYYRAEHTIGFSMTCHGATLQQSEIELFDNQFFGIDGKQAQEMAPYMRILLEVGYEALHNAGHQKNELKGFKCGVFVGDSGSDWDGVHWTPTEMRPMIFAGRERCAAANRLSHIFGLTGPTSTAETACSSSLVACGVAQMTMRSKLEDQITPNVTTDLKHSLVMGSNTLIGPGGYISLSGPGMLTHQGRCFTFDHSADGFARGEGIGAVKLKVCEDSFEAAGRVAMLIGCSVNQDGRSASMTAPHGPSQQEVIRQSMREAGVSPNLITIAECHGTGTALGDPIEIGALRGVLRADRSTPILKTSSKTNLGHLEAGAGLAGLIKCICMLNYSTGAPNIHLLVLNPHLDVAGYPVYFESELIDYGSNSGLTGVSSFGFGGTNARADVWGHATKGHRYAISGPLESLTAFR